MTHLSLVHLNTNYHKKKMWEFMMQKSISKKKSYDVMKFSTLYFYNQLLKTSYQRFIVIHKKKLNLVPSTKTSIKKPNQDN